jgi:hypothetical protein
MRYPTRRALSTSEGDDTALRQKTKRLLAESKLRKSYESELVNRRENAPKFAAQMAAAFSTNADPVLEAEPHVKWRDELKQSTRAQMPPAMHELIARRQENKYRASDPTAGSLMAKHLLSMSGESAAGKILESSTRGADDFTGEFAARADAEPPEWHRKLHREMDGMSGGNSGKK